MSIAYQRASRGPVAGRLADTVVAISATGGGQGRGKDEYSRATRLSTGWVRLSSLIRSLRYGTRRCESS